MDEAEKLASRVKKNKKAESRWLRTRVLIIDEVSMVDGALFDKLNQIGRIVRKRLEPFGGIQVLDSGHLFSHIELSHALRSSSSLATSSNFLL